MNDKFKNTPVYNIDDVMKACEDASGKEPSKELLNAKHSQEELNTYDAISEVFNSPEWKDHVHSIFRDVIDPLFELFNSPEWKDLVKESENNARELLPHIEKVLASSSKYKGITAEQVLDNMDVLGKTVNPEELTGEILKRAKQKKRAADARKSQRKRTEGLETSGDIIRYFEGDTFKSTSTPLANDFFTPDAKTKEINGQLALRSCYCKKGANRVDVYSAINYNYDVLNTYGIKGEFTDFDFFIAMVCNNLYSEGNCEVSLTKIWHEMGNAKAPNAKQLQEIKKSLIKGASTYITISNKSLLELYGIETDTYVDIHSNVFPVRLKDDHSRVNGNITKETVKIYDFSPFMLIAEPLDQIAPWNKNVLKLYTGTRTKRYYSVLRFLMSRIAWMRNDKTVSQNIRLSTLFHDTRATRTEDRNASRDITTRLLEEVFIPCGYVRGFKIDEDRQVIKLDIIYPKKKISK